MYNRRQVQEEIYFAGTLEMLASAFEEISVMRIQKVKGFVLSSRQFLDELSSVFRDVKSAHKRKITLMLKERDKKSGNLVTQPGKEVVVLMGANTRLYGNIVPKVFDFFMKNIINNTCDIVIIGKLGKELFDQADIKKPYTYFELSDYETSIESMKEVISYLANYPKITVFYGKFLNVANQEPTASDISGQTAMKTQEGGEESVFNAIFEPTLEDIINFFETQVLATFFQQTVHESQLARYASRIMAMEGAIENISQNLKSLKGQERRLKMALSNKKQSETLSRLLLV